MKTKIILVAIGLTLAQFSFAHSEQHAKKPNRTVGIWEYLHNVGTLNQKKHKKWQKKSLAM